MAHYNEIWSEILAQFGEDNMRQLIELLHCLDELYDSAQKKLSTEN